MKTKDCFFGQVRAVAETHHGKLNTWTPTALNVTKQFGVTWNNLTGMNPLYDKATVPVIHQSYGEPLAIAASRNYSFINDFISSNESVEYYDRKIKEDYNSHYARFAQVLATFWGIDQILAQDDCNEFDFITARQFDTVWKADGSNINRKIEHIFGEHTQTLSDATANIQSIPLVYGMSKDILQEDQFTEFPVAGTTRCTSFIFNREAAAILKGKFFDLALEELEIVYEQINTDMQSQLHSWNLGYNIHRMLVKCDIHTIDINRYNVLAIPPKWNPDVSDNFGHVNRAECGVSD